MRFDIGRVLRKSFRRHPSIAHLFVPILRTKDALQGRAMHEQMDASIDRFCSPEEKADPRYIRRLKRDMWYSFLQYHCSFNEYFLFHFPSLSHTGRTEFISDNERAEICTPLVSPEVLKLFQNKWNTYQKFRGFYDRDAMIVTAHTSYDEFLPFAEKHTAFIVKPLEESCGRGIRLVDTSAESDLQALFRLLQEEKVILEERIVQSEPLARLHPASVNTVRCATFLKDGEPHILFAVLRMGQGNSLVDNASAGGLIATINVETGIVETPGVSEFNFSSLSHPTTGVQIIGMTIPHWTELTAMAKELALVVPEQKYVGWDLALTDRGWVVVEGNCIGQFLPQISSQRGLRNKLRPYFNL